MLTTKRLKGNQGEKQAETFLKKRGFKLLIKNYQNKFGEIDLICRRGNSIHFIEVKSAFSYFDPAQNMTKKKLNKIIKTAQIFINQNNYNDLSYYFDLVTVNFKRKKIYLYPNINTDFD